jgi:hypothetical protein
VVIVVCRSEACEPMLAALSHEAQSRSTGNRDVDDVIGALGMLDCMS